MLTVRCRQQEKFAIDGITKRKALRFRETGDGVQEEFLAFVGVLQSPGFPAIRRLVNAGHSACAAGHHVSRAGVERHDASKVERFSAGNVYAPPRRTRVD